MNRWIAGCLLLAAMAQASAMEWLPLKQGPGLATFYDPASVDTTGGLGSVWTMSLTPAGDAVTVAYIVLCERRKAAIAAINMRNAATGKVESVILSRSQLEWHDIPHDYVDAAVEKLVCKPRRGSK